MHAASLIPVVVQAAAKGKVTTGAAVFLATDSSEAAAVVQFGAFCLDVGCEKGIACLSVASLLTLSRSAEQDDSQQLTCFVRNPRSDALRRVFVHII